MQNIVSQVPSHLKKVLYIPRHNEAIPQFVVYDFSKQYSECVGQLPLGSEDYKVELCVLRKPNGERAGDNARFMVNLDEDRTSMLVRERSLGRDPVEADVSLPTSEEKEYAFDAHTRTTSFHNYGYLNYPLPEKRTKKQLIRYPYLTLNGTIFPHQDAEKGQYEWQVHPVEKGPLRYELVDLGEKRSGDGDSSILAIYHHHGFESELPASHSHGVLLLPSTSTPDFEIAVLSSILALLSAVRQQSTQKRRWYQRHFMACL
ncbi:hypothetical protein FLONG3_4656 [Fusarium longipes]|uniref:Uncharacterized protein n=1 Tax=Fusarium longipes TaxID=694270 RepID=A0A395SXD4_9HYPO|nr:hypothetical protein FLONG3_4656 [Fusarium longipes]